MTAVSELTFRDPYGMSFVRWAALLTEDLAEYNVLVPPASEEGWVAWADRLVEIQEIADLGAPGPRSFSDWRSWAASLSHVLW